MKVFYKYFLLALFMMVLFLCSNKKAKAAENVNVTIPTEINIIFNEDGTNKVSDFVISNHSKLPIIIDSVCVTEQNGWKMVKDDTEILVNTKQIVFKQENQCLMAGENQMNLTIPEKTERALNLEVVRGAWTTPCTSEAAFQLEFNYSVGNSLFELTLDGYDTMSVYNGEEIELPQPEKEGFEFGGWKDSEGNIYTDVFTMPVGNVTLTPIWKEIVVYAIYSEDDYSLNFYRTAEELNVGDTYDGRTITKLYTGFDKTTFATKNDNPWFVDGLLYKVKSIAVKDEIKPKSTAYWFYYSNVCESIDVEKLDVSEVTNMIRTFSYCGFNAPKLSMSGLDSWDVSNVTNMEHMFSFAGRDAAAVKIDISSWKVSKVTTMESMFSAMGYFSTTFSLGNLGKWDVSSLTNADEMFKNTGGSATYKLDLSKWNVKNVTNHFEFNKNVTTKVIAPTWSD